MFMAAGVCISIEGLALISHISSSYWIYLVWTCLVLRTGGFQRFLDQPRGGLAGRVYMDCRLSRRDNDGCGLDTYCLKVSKEDNMY
jgi:hypothetical protein